jgi:hypothetical protein
VVVNSKAQVGYTALSKLLLRWIQFLAFGINTVLFFGKNLLHLKVLKTINQNLHCAQDDKQPAFKIAISYYYLNSNYRSACYNNDPALSS